jgi:hypothetical protein
MKPIETQFIENFPSLKQYMYEDIRSKCVFNLPEMQEILLEHTIDKDILREAMTKVSKIYGGYTGDDALIRLSKELKLEEK